MTEAPDPRPAGARVDRRLVAWALALAVGGLAASLPNATPTFDSVAYSLDVERTLITGGGLPQLLHPFHVAFGPVGLLGSKLLGPLGFDPLLVFQLLNALSLGVVAVLVLRSLRAAGPWLAAGAALLVAGWGSTLYYATQGEPYLPALAAALGSWTLVVESPRPGRGRLAASGALLGLAVALHGSLGVLAPLVALGAPGLQWRPLRSALGRIALVAAVSILVVLPPYALRWTLLGEGWSGALRDTIGEMAVSGNQASDDYFLNQGYQPLVELRAVVGSVRHQLVDGAASVVLLAVPLALLALLLLALPRALRTRDRRLLLDAGAFLALLLFFTSYNLASGKFTVFIASFLVLAGASSAAALLRSSKARRRAGPVVFAAGVVLLTTNVLGGAVPAAREESNPWMPEVVALGDGLAPEDALLLVGRTGQLKVNVPYYARREVIILDFLFAHGTLSAEESLARARARVLRVLQRGGAVHAAAGLLEEDEELRAFRRRNELGDLDLLAALGLEPTDRVVRVAGEVVAVRLRPRSAAAPAADR